MNGANDEVLVINPVRARPSPRWHYGWVIVANGFFVEMVVMGTALYAYSVFVLPLSREFGTGVFAAMLGLTGLNIAVAALSPLAGHLITRGSSKAYMLLGLVLLGTGFFMVSWVTALWQLITLYALLIGFGYAFVAPIAASAVITNWFTTLRGRALSIAAIGTSFGGLVIPPIAAYIIHVEDWRTAMLFFSALYFIVSIPLVWWLVVDTPAQKGLGPYGTTESETKRHGNTTTTEPTPWTTRTLLADKHFWLIAFAIGSGFAVFMGLTANIVPYATTLGYSEQQGALFLSGLTACAIIGKMIFAVITDRIGLRNTFWTALCLNLIAMAFLILIPTYITLFIATICVGLSSGGLLPSWPGLIAHQFGREALAKVMGLSAPIVNGAMMLSPPFAGLMFDLYNDYRLAFVVFLVVIVLALWASRNLGSKWGRTTVATLPTVCKSCNSKP